MTTHHTLNVATWNVLADCYANGSAASGVITSWKKRKLLLENILKLLSKRHDILFLQEVDHADDFYRPLLHSCGYNSYYYQRPNKSDGTLIAFLASHFILHSVEEVNFNDLTERFHEMDITRQSFRRHNIALILCLKLCDQSQSSLSTNTSSSGDGGSSDVVEVCDHFVLVSTAHLYWNPTYPEVKTGQVKYLLDRIGFFRTKLNLSCNLCSKRKKRENLSESNSQDRSVTHSCPIILGGDFNSTPDSEQYHLLTSYQPMISRYLSPVQSLTSLSSHTKASCCYCGLNTFVLKSSHSRSDPAHYFHGCYYGGNQTRFLCDATLSKLCRWLRVLGLNAAMHLPNKANSTATQAGTTKAKKPRNGHPQIRLAPSPFILHLPSSTDSFILRRTLRF
jgi:mRNA deadenylase 3'-5' endonuclease subunit Ccr4